VLVSCETDHHAGFENWFGSLGFFPEELRDTHYPVLPITVSPLGLPPELPDLVLG